MFDPLKSALSVFPMKRMGRADIKMLARASSARSHAAVFETVNSWIDVLSIPDNLLGPVPLFFEDDVSTVLCYMEGHDFVDFIPGWLILAYERSFALGVHSTVLACLSPGGVIGSAINEDGSSDLDRIRAMMTEDQIVWVHQMLKLINEMSVGKYACSRQLLDELLDYWSPTSQLKVD